MSFKFVFEWFVAVHDEPAMLINNTLIIIYPFRQQCHWILTQHRDASQLFDHALCVDLAHVAPGVLPRDSLDPQGPSAVLVMGDLDPAHGWDIDIVLVKTSLFHQDHLGRSTVAT